MEDLAAAGPARTRVPRPARRRGAALARVPDRRTDRGTVPGPLGTEQAALPGVGVVDEAGEAARG
ncbi:hypothetical protein ADK35_30170 [Streptomyces viridochromogenes]|nr:hypothetical protein ADK36_30525 [Streptomyces viridochromogenes]KOG15081.1 hypothetical protein ADK35_30170 [Streptomyces viridochromogenes]